jgi:hypothetical protein
MNKCKTDVPEPGMNMYFTRCKRNEWKDGYCRQHHPDTINERQDRRNKKFDARTKLSTHNLFLEAKKEIVKLKQEVDYWKNKSAK